MKWSFTTCNTLGESSQVYKTLWRNYRYIKRSHISIMKKLPLVTETSATLPTAKLTTRQLCAFNRTHIQHQNLASSNFSHLWKTALWIRPSNFIFLSCTKPLGKLHSFPTETELFSICILIIHRIRSKRYPHKQYFASVEKRSLKLFWNNTKDVPTYIH